MGVASSATSNWRQEHFDSAHSGVNPYERLVSRENVSDLVSNWTADQDVRILASPVVADGMVYSAGVDLSDTSSGVAFALDESSGRELWRVRQPGAGGALGIAVCNGQVFVGSLFDHALRAYTAATGRLLWTVHADGAVSSPTLARGRVYVQTNIGSVYAVDRRTGAVVWQRPYGGLATSSSPAVYRGIVYVAGGNSRQIKALNAADGHLVWKKTLAARTLSSPTIVDGLLYEAVAEAGIYALSAGTGDIVWHRLTGQGAESAATVDAAAAYIGNVDGVVHAFDRKSGHGLWTASLGQRFVLNSPIEANGVVYAATTGVFALDAKSGEQLWSAPSGEVNSDPAVVEGVLYVGDFDGQLRAFHLPGW